MKKKQRKPLDPRAQLGIAIAAPLLLLAVGWLMVVGPQRSKATTVAGQVATAQTQLATQQAQVLHAPKPQPIRVADLYQMVKAMPDQQDMPGIILQLNQVATEAGIGFQSIQPGAETAGTGYEMQQISLGFTGNFYGLSDFLYRLRNLVAVRAGKLDATGRLFSVEQVSFSEGPKTFPQIQAQLVVDAYVYGATATAAPATPPPPTGTDTGETTTSTDSTTTTTTTDSTATPTAAPADTGVNG
ncbi:MAG TPA: type 4a pilus biogenesis protein PilO [Gaiellaceae bacterium]|nr:type 4a pilus biogenesis protein PilO [Gaiellaceae bacterium]